MNLITVPWLTRFDSLQTALGCLKLLPGVPKILYVDVFEFTIKPRYEVF